MSGTRLHARAGRETLTAAGWWDGGAVRRGWLDGTTVAAAADRLAVCGGGSLAGSDRILLDGSWSFLRWAADGPKRSKTAGTKPPSSTGAKRKTQSMVKIKCVGAGDFANGFNRTTTEPPREGVWVTPKFFLPIDLFSSFYFSSRDYIA